MSLQNLIISDGGLFPSATGGGGGVNWVSVPSSASASGTLNDMALDPATQSLYICFGSGNWAKFFGNQAFSNGDYNYVSIGDTNGIVYKLVSVAKTPLVISLDRAQGAATDVINRTLEYTSTGNSANEWIAFDLGSGVRSTITKYTCAYFSGNTGQISRNWKIQGTNAISTWDSAGVNGAIWTDIDNRVNDATINASPWNGVFTCNLGNSNAYRYIRYYNTGANLGGLGYIQVAEIEFYGHLTF